MQRRETSGNEKYMQNKQRQSQATLFTHQNQRHRQVAYPVPGKDRTGRLAAAGLLTLSPVQTTGQ